MPEDTVETQGNQSEQENFALGTRAARNLATVTKTTPQMGGITPRWLLHLLPWVQVSAGTYRVNRRRVVHKEDQKVRARIEDGQAAVDPKALRALGLLRGLSDTHLESLARSFSSESRGAGETVMEQGDKGDTFFIIASGKVEVSTVGPHGENLRLAVLADGDYFGEMALLHGAPRSATVRTLTPCVFLTLKNAQFAELLADAPEVRKTIERAANERRAAMEAVESYGEAPIDLTAAHEGQPDLTETFPDYEDDPKEYELSIIQTVVKIHTRVADLYNEPIDQVREQLRLTIESMKELQEYQVLNNLDFGLTNAVAPSMRIQPRNGTPTPDDLDELLSRVWKDPAFFLAHPRAIAAFGRECTRRGVPPPTTLMYGTPFLTWRGVPIIPSDKLLVDGQTRPMRSVGRTKILLMRVGEAKQGVVGLHQAGISGEQMPSLSVRFMGIDRKAIASYLMTLYFSAAVLMDDALGMLENVEVGYYHDYD